MSLTTLLSVFLENGSDLHQNISFFYFFGKIRDVQVSNGKSVAPACSGITPIISPSLCSASDCTNLPVLLHPETLRPQPSANLSIVLGKNGWCLCIVSGHKRDVQKLKESCSKQCNEPCCFIFLIRSCKFPRHRRFPSMGDLLFIERHKPRAQAL